MCESHLDGFHSGAVAGGRRSGPNRWWALSAVKDIAQSRGEAGKVGTEQAKGELFYLVLRHNMEYKSCKVWIYVCDYVLCIQRLITSAGIN